MEGTGTQTPSSGPPAGDGATVEPGRLRQTFAALRYPNYRRWFFGQLVSLFGTWMQTTAQGFLLFELTHSPRYLGYAGFAAGVPTWLFTLYGGVVADRIPRRTLMTVTQSAMMTLAFVLAALTILRLVQPWEILILASLLGIANSFDAPARLAFVNELVERKDLTNAIALNSTMFQMATIVGPAAAGITYAWLGPGWCFLINGFSFVAVIVALRLMKLPAWIKPPKRSSTLSQLKEGLRYVARHQTIRVLIGMIAVTSMFTLSFATLIPAWTVNVLHGDAKVNGLLYSARGAGSLLGALLIASLGPDARRGRLFTAGSLLYPILFMLLAFTRWTELALILLACAGVGMIMVMNLANAMVQTSTPDDLRGRVMGAYTWIFFGFMPLGALWSGTLAEHLGEPAVVVINASAALLFAATTWMFAPGLREQ